MSDAQNIAYRIRKFHELTVVELYAILALRQKVFVVEQRCAYLDADGLDLHSTHLWIDSAGAAIGYLRVVPMEVKYSNVCSIGRVAIAPEARKRGLSRHLIRHGLAIVGQQPVRIGAQAYLEKFYASLGFVRISDEYQEDGIPHVDMLYQPP